jgi:F-type H+-transporting ATPase subunit b
MDLVTPGIGLIFWTTLVFLLLLILLRVFAWKPILNAVNNREKSIKSALESAEKAKDEMKKLQKRNEEILREAKSERELIMKEAKEIKEKIITEAKDKAGQEANKLIELARQAIRNEKASAINELRQQVAVLSVEIAEKILREKLEKDKDQTKLINRLLDDIKIN